MCYRKVSQEIRNLSLNSKDFTRNKIASIQHYEIKRQEATLLTSLSMPLFRMEIFEFSKAIPSFKALQRIEKEHGTNFSILFCNWSISHKKINVWKLINIHREQMRDTLSLLARRDRFYFLHYHYLPTLYCPQDVLIEQVIAALEHERCLDHFQLGKLLLQHHKNPPPQLKPLPSQDPKLSFYGSGNLCDILHNKMTTNIKSWIDFYNDNKPQISKGGYDECYLNLRIACSYFLFYVPNRDAIYRDLQRMQQLNQKVFDFLEFFATITNDESRQEFYCKRFFKQFEYEHPSTLTLLVKLSKQYGIEQVIKWIDLCILIYEESYISSHPHQFSFI